jgi:hypothetical protein
MGDGDHGYERYFAQKITYIGIRGDALPVDCSQAEQALIVIIVQPSNPVNERFAVSVYVRHPFFSYPPAFLGYVNNLPEEYESIGRVIDGSRYTLVIKVDFHKVMRLIELHKGIDRLCGA